MLIPWTYKTVKFLSHPFPMHHVVGELSQTVTPSVLLLCILCLSCIILYYLSSSVAKLHPLGDTQGIKSLKWVTECRDEWENYNTHHVHDRWPRAPLHPRETWVRLLWLHQQAGCGWLTQTLDFLLGGSNVWQIESESCVLPLCHTPWHVLVEKMLWKVEK